MTDVAANAPRRAATGTEDDEEDGKEKENTDSLDGGHVATVESLIETGYGV